MSIGMKTPWQEAKEKADRERTTWQEALDRVKAKDAALREACEAVEAAEREEVAAFWEGMRRATEANGACGAPADEWGDLPT